jgi:hypothetical protein
MDKVPKKGNPNYVPYYPDSKYVNKNFAPEYFPVDSLRSLARAEVAARKSGVLSQKLSGSLLPIALVEGRPDDFGFNELGYPRSKKTDSLFEKMGMKVGAITESQPPPESENWADTEWEQWDAKVSQGLDIAHYPSGGTRDGTPASVGQYAIAKYDDDPFKDLDRRAKIAAVALAMKADLYGEDMAIERWNGIGSGAKNHARKVEVMRQMLSHEKNKSLRDAYAKILREVSQEK